MTECQDEKCPCCSGSVEEFPGDDGARECYCTHCGWREHVPGSMAIAAALTLQHSRQQHTEEASKPANRPEQKQVCADCGREFPADENLPAITDFWDRMCPGDTMPSGQCPDCGALCYLTEPQQKPETVVLFVEDGAVQGVEGTAHVRVVICDFDVPEGGQTVSGRPCCLSIWPEPDAPSGEFREVARQADEGPATDHCSDEEGRQ